MKFDLIEERAGLELAAFKNFVKTLDIFLKPKTILLLKGDLGSGKTELVKNLLPGDIVSPTFALQQTYNLPSRLQIDHWDLYRLESEDDLESAAFWDQFMNDDFCVLIEWPERLNFDQLPKFADIFLVEIFIEGEKRRVRLSRRS